MADINNFTEITENFDTIKTLLNSIRAQGILNTSDVDKLLSGINTKLEKLNTEEDIDLIKIFLSELKQNLDERHNVLLSKFGAIESLFSNLLKNSSETLKSSEIKELFDIVATNLSVFSREVVSQKESLTDITLRIDAMRSDDSDKKEIIKNVALLKNDIERLTNGFDSIVLSLNENFKTIIKNISSIDYSDNMEQFSKEVSDITNSFNTILSAIQVLDKKSLQIEDALRGLATQDDLNATKQWISDLASHEQALIQSVDGLADKYYKIDNLAEKIDASVDIIAGLKTVIAESNEDNTKALIERLNLLENKIVEITTNDDFDEFKRTLESTINSIFDASSTIKMSIDGSAHEIQRISDIVSELDLNVTFKTLSADLNRSEQNIREHVNIETNKVIELVDVNTSRTINEILSNADILSTRINESHAMMSALCEKSFADVVENVSALRAVLSQIDENNVSANNAIFSNITDRLAIFESGLKASLEKQENYVSNSSSVLIEQLKSLKDLSGVFDYKLDSSVIEINNAKAEFSSLKTAVEEVLSLDFVNKVKDMKVDLYAIKQDLLTTVDSATGDLSEKLSNDLYAKYELLISKLDSVETEIKQANTVSLNNMKGILESISASLVDVLSYVSSTHEVNTEALEAKIELINRTVNDNTLNYIENVRDIVEVIRVQVENNLKSIQEDSTRQFNSLKNSILTSNENIREDIKNSYKKLIEVQDNFDDIKNAMSDNRASLSLNINDVLNTAENLRDDFDAKLTGLKNSILDSVIEFKKDFTCENADKISEIKFASEALHNKALKYTSDINNELKGEFSKLIGSLKLNLEEFAEQLASTSLKLEGVSSEVMSYIKNDFTIKVDNSVDELISKISDYTSVVNDKTDDVVKKVADLEDTVESLSTTTTSSLSSTLAKILENFVSLKALLGTFNEGIDEKLKNSVELVVQDFMLLKERMDEVDRSIDEDLTRQLKLLESNFEMMNQNLIEMLDKNGLQLSETLKLGVENISDSVKNVIVDNLEQYQIQIERLFENIVKHNSENSSVLTEKVIELDKVLHCFFNEQSSLTENSLNEISTNLNDILAKNIELSSADYEALKARFEVLTEEIINANSTLGDKLKSQFNEIEKSIENELDRQAQTVNTKFNEITLSIGSINDAAAKLNSDLEEEVEKLVEKILNLKEDLLLSGKNEHLDLISKLDNILDVLAVKNENLLASVIKLSTESNDLLSESIDTGVQKTIEKIITELSDLINETSKSQSEVLESKINNEIINLSKLIKDENLQHDNILSANLSNLVKEIETLSLSSAVSADEIKALLNNFANKTEEDALRRYNDISAEVKLLSKNTAERTSVIETLISDNLNTDIQDLAKKLHSLFEEHSLNLITQLGNGNSVILEDLKIKSLELKEAFSSLNTKLDKDDLAQMNLFQAQLNELNVTFNDLIGEAKDVTKSEVSAISETLIKNSKVVMEEVEQSIDDKINSLLAVSADISAGELKAMENFSNKILEQVEVNKQIILSCQDFINNFVKAEISTIAENIEKETDAIISDLLDQTQALKDFLRDECSKLTVHIESSVEDYIYEHISDLKSYLDVKLDSTVLNSKLDSISHELSKSSESVLSVANKLLESDIFENRISELEKTNEVVISSMADTLNNQLQDFIKNNISKDISDKFLLFDKNFTDCIVDKYEEIKVISTQYNNAFENIELSLKGLIEDFVESKNEINNAVSSAMVNINDSLDDLNSSFEDLKAQILNKSFDEAFQASVNNQVSEIQNLIEKQMDYLDDISELCANNLPDLTEMNALVKYNIIESINNVTSKLDSNEALVKEEIVNLKSEIITQFLNVFNQISFITEQEEILDFIQEKHSELITILSHIVRTVDDVETVKDNLAVVDNKVDAIKEDIDLINEKITSIMSSSGDIDYVYSLQDLESDIANLRLCLNSIQNDNSSKELEALISSTNDIYSLVDSIKNELPNLKADEFKKDFDALSEDIVSISTRTNKLILASDESYKKLEDNLQDFRLVINDLDERTRNFAQEAGLDRIDNKLGAINSMIQSGAKTNQVFNQVFEYLAEWVDNAGAQITSISDKVESLNDIGQIKVMLEDLKAESEDNSESLELIEALGNVFDKQAKKIASLEAKLDRVIVETTINNKNNKIDLSPMEETLNRFLVAIGDKISSQQDKIDLIESKLESVASQISPDSTVQLTKKVGGMDRQIAKLNKSIEKIASHVIEK